MKRYAGVLLPVTSLPSKYGIGCFDQAAYDFVDWLQKAGQRYWQILPLGATSYGSSDDSPYQAYSAFAGNPYLISLDALVEEGVLPRTPVKHFVAGISAGIIDDAPMLDLPYSEDSRAMVDLNCVMNELGEIIELQGTGEGRAFTAAEQQELVELCAKGCRELIRKEKDILGEVL